MPDDSKERIALDLMELVLEKDTSLSKTKEALISLYKECLVAAYHKNWQND